MSKLRDAITPHSAVGLLEQFKYEIMRQIAAKSKPIQDDEP